MNNIYLSYKESRDSSDHLKHYGVIGMKWGVRRWENKDGTLTEAGKKHYAKPSDESSYKSLDTRIRERALDTDRSRATSYKNASEWYKTNGDYKRADKYNRKYEKVNNRANRKEKIAKYSREFDKALEKFGREYTGPKLRKSVMANAVEIASRTGMKPNDKRLINRARGRTFIQGLQNVGIMTADMAVSAIADVTPSTSLHDYNRASRARDRYIRRKLRG